MGMYMTQRCDDIEFFKGVTMAELSKEMFEAGISGLYGRLDTISGHMEKIEEKVNKIETQGNRQAERIVTIETKLENFKESFSDHKSREEKEHEAWFEKLRLLNKEIREAIDERIEGKNSKQELRIISTSVATASALIGIVLGLLKLFGVM